MSRYYEMSVEIRSCDETKHEAIQPAAAAEWPGFSDWHFIDGPQATGSGIRSYGEGQLWGGETEEQFADRLAVAIWRANGRYCEVSVDATFLENLPYESHFRDESDYERLMTQAKSCNIGDSS